MGESLDNQTKAVFLQKLILNNLTISIYNAAKIDTV